MTRRFYRAMFLVSVEGIDNGFIVNIEPSSSMNNPMAQGGPNVRKFVENPLAVADLIRDTFAKQLERRMDREEED